MKFNKFQSIIFICILFCFNFTEAKTILTFDKCIQLVKDQNIDLKTALHTLEIYKNSEKQARAAFLPEVVAGIDFSKDNTSARSRNTAITITERLFNGFADYANLRKNQLEKDNSEIDLKAAKAELTYNLRSAIARVLFAIDYEKVTKGIADRRENNFKKVRLLYESGRENKGTFLVIQGFWRRAQMEYEESKDLKTWAYKELATILGIDPNEELELDKSLTINSLVNEEDIKSALELYKKAEENKKLSFDLIASNFEYQKTVNDEKASRETIVSSSSGFLPSVSISQSYNTEYNYIDEKSKGWNLALSISIPLFNGGANYYDMKVALEKQRMAVLEKQRVQHDVEKVLLEALKDLKRKVEKLKIEKDLLEAFELSDKIATEQYFNNFISFRDWNWAYSDLVDQQVSYFSMQNELIMQQSLVEKLQGKSLLE